MLLCGFIWSFMVDVIDDYPIKWWEVLGLYETGFIIDNIIGTLYVDLDSYSQKYWSARSLVNLHLWNKSKN